MKKLIVKDGVCIGCGACVAVDSTHFDFNENGLSEVINNDNLDTDEVKSAISSCPVNAIKLVDDANTCDCGDNCTCGDQCNCSDDCSCHQ